MITPERLSELRALADAATLGPWVTFDASGSDDDDDTLPHILMPASMRERPAWNEIGYISEDYPDDAQFIAAAREAVPELLDEIDRLARELAALRAAAQEVDDAHSNGTVSFHLWAALDRLTYVLTTVPDEPDDEHERTHDGIRIDKAIHPRGDNA